MNNFIPGQAVIEEVTLISADGKKTQDITGLTTMIELFETITLPCVTAAVTIVDTTGLADSFPIHGVEMIRVRFKPIIPNVNSTEYEFRVHEQKATTISYTKKMQAYTLRCVDLDFFESVKKTVEKSYKTTHAEMITDIVNRVVGSTKLFVEPTKGKQDLIIPGVNPYQAADLVRRKSTSSAYEYAPYFFFRTINQGFVFTTLANLYNKGKGRPKRKFQRLDTFITNTRFEVPLVTLEYNNILNIIFPKKFNNSGKVAAGAFASTTATFDILSKRFTEQDFKLTSSKFKGKIKGGYDTFVKNQTESSTTHYIVVDSSRPSTFESTTLGSKQSYMLSITDDNISIEIHGDNTLSVGDVIQVTIPILDAEVLDGNKVDYETLSGEYIITKVKHVLLRELRTHYKTELQLVRNTTVYEQ